MTPSSSTPEPTVATSTPRPSTVDGTDLVIVYEDGSGQKSRWQLACDPAGGTHPDPAAACEILAAHGAAGPAAGA